MVVAIGDDRGAAAAAAAVYWGWCCSLAVPGCSGGAVFLLVLAGVVADLRFREILWSRHQSDYCCSE